MAATEPYKLEDRYLADHGTVFLTGIQALARLPLEQLRADQRAGLNTAALVSGYQGSPLGGYGEAVDRVASASPDLPLKVRRGMNEEYAATTIMGTQLASARPDARYDGVIGIWYGKAPGVDRAADALRHGVYAGTSMNGGAIALVGDDPLAKSSTVPSSSAGLLADMHMPLLYPGDPGEALDLGRHAISLSRATGLWSAVKIVAAVADATATVVLDPDRVNPIFPLIDGERYQHVPDGRLLTPHTIDIEREIMEVQYELAREYASENELNHLTTNPSDGWIGIMASGISYREVREALARLGLPDETAISGAGIRLLKMGMPMPFNQRTVREFARGLEQILVIEEKSPNMESLLKDALYALSDRPIVVGKQDERGQILLPAYGALDADKIMPILRARLADRIGDRLTPEVQERSRTLIPLSVQRAPAFCSGCPHNRSTETPDGAAFGAGIGCHTMTLFMDPDRVGDMVGITCMGNEGTQWIGMADYVETDHLFQNLGDGTYFHSGQLAVQAAVASGVNITYKLLYNGTVAMTGGQDPEGQIGVEAVAHKLLTEGVARVLITTEDRGRYRRRDLPRGVEVWGRERLIEAQELLAKVPGTTVLIHDQACAAENRRARKRGLLEAPNQRVVINARICEGCGDCGQVSNCLSVQPVETPFGRKTEIDQTTCNLDYSCLEGDCPSFMAVKYKEPGRLAKLFGRDQGPTAAGPVAPSSGPTPPDAPDPELVVPEDDFAMRITGIGGTGVVTVAQVLGTAAMLAGYNVRGLDQIGLSQKAGPVLSDVRLSRSGPTPTNRLGRGQADLLLAFDQLVAGSDRGLLASDKAATVAVGSTSTTPTGDMITHLDLALPSVDELVDRINTQTRDGHHWADAQAITEDIFGQSTTANMFVVGMAVQAGALPIGAGFVEQAITLNGVAVDSNTAAFRWGRAQVFDPAAVEAARLRQRGEAVESEIEALTPDVRARLDSLAVSGDLLSELDMYAAELVGWGSASTTETWLGTIENVRAAERSVAGASQSLTAAVGAGLFKLMAYKDEYEVARLMTDQAALREANEAAGAGGSVAWKLHPPILRALGINKKISVGSWATPGVRVLAKGKRLRGTMLDPFRWPEVRKIERALPGEYVEAIEHVLATLSTANLDAAVAVADLPDLVRGYEDIKLANVEIYRARLGEALEGFAG